MKKLILFLFLTVSLSNLFGQKSPYYIHNYKSTEYNGFNQTWQITQNNQGLIFVAGTSTVFLYNGEQWERIPVKSGAACRQILYDSITNDIYIGSVSDFGCLEKDSSGKYRYRSFVPQLDEKQKEFLDVWKVHKQGNRIYFQSSERIFVVENKKVIGTIEASDPNKFALMFNCGGKLFVRQRNVGIMEVDGLTIKKVAGSDAYGSIRILGMVPVNNELVWVLTGDKGVHEFRGWKTGTGNFNVIHNSNDSLLMNAGVLGCKWISESEIAVFGRSGLMIFDPNWNLLHLFNKKTGLGDESVSEIFIDRERNIWVTHNNGLSRISYNSPMLFYSDEFGFTGTIESADFFQDSTYLATSEGLFVAEKPLAFGTDLRFHRAIDIRTEVWNLFPEENYMLLCTSEGVLLYENRQTRSLTPYYTNVCVRTSSDQPMLFTAERGGFSFLVPDAKTHWKMAWHFDLPGIELIHSAQPKQDKNDPMKFEFWATTRLKTIVHITANLKDSSFVIHEYGKANGIEADNYYPVSSADSVWFFTMNYALRYNPAKDKGKDAVCFENAPEIYMKLFQGDLKDIRYPFDYRLFLEHSKFPFDVFFGKDSSGYYASRVSLGGIFSGMAIQSGMVKDHKTVFMLNQQSITLFNLEQRFNPGEKFFALISQAVFKGDSAGLFYPASANGIEMPYSKNGVSFSFCAPYFMYDLKSYFSYKLDGYDTGWSKLNPTTLKEYTNLPEGTYTFRLRAMNDFGMESQEAAFTFTILPPWYRTGWAYLAYAILTILLFWLAIRIGVRRLRKQKERLEQIVSQRTAEVVKQKQQIEIQKLELESTYTDIKDSIQYAKRIQDAMLPVETEITKLIPDSFIYFRPRDIVSGDFYWFTGREGKTYLACVDCTGHGVPGALMSMIGTTLLNQLVIEKEIESPDIILNELHTGVRHALKQDTGGITRDGMDLALCVIDHSKNQLLYAGANRSFWLIRNGQLNEIKADKFPIAGDQPEAVRRFTSHTVSLQDGDCIYLSTDGYADQFGGEKGKKFMVKKFQQFLISIHEMPMHEQKKRIESAFTDWKGIHEQVDDVLVTGFRYQMKA